MQAMGETVGGAQIGLLSGASLDEVIARYPSQGARAFLTDALNSVLAQARDDLSIQNYYAYSPYGEVSVLGPDEGNSIQYTGRENDQTGLYFHRARYYDPLLKRFISEDPAGIHGGINQHAYVEGDPIGRADPLGLWWPGIHNSLSYTQALEAGMDRATAQRLGQLTGDVDNLPGSQDPVNSHWHAMQDPGIWKFEAEQNYRKHVAENLDSCDLRNLAMALHAIQDSYSPAHGGFKKWYGWAATSGLSLAWHGFLDSPLMFLPLMDAKKATRSTIKDWQCRCGG
jgi:RHS repeat-associated protein